MASEPFECAECGVDVEHVDELTRCADCKRLVCDDCSHWCCEPEDEANGDWFCTQCASTSEELVE